MSNDYNASSRDYDDMCRAASRDYQLMEQARIARKNREASEKIAIAIEKQNILKECELNLITKEEALEKIRALEEPPKKKFFR